MQINWTEQNSWTGPGLAAPTHPHTHTYIRKLTHKHKIEMLQSTDPVPTKLKLTPHRIMIHMQPLRQYTVPKHASLRSLDLLFVNLQLCKKRYSWYWYCPKSCSIYVYIYIIILKAHPTPPNSLGDTHHPKGSDPCPTQGSPSKKVNTQKDKASILTCQKHRI